jgi:hypothetical protein
MPTQRLRDAGVIGLALALALAIFVVFDDAIIGIAIGAAFYAIANRLLGTRTVGTDRHAGHR